MPELQRLRAGHAPAVLAFELASRAYFAASISDRGDEFFDQFADRHSALLAEQEAGRCACYVLVAEDGSVLGRFNLYDLQDGTAAVGYRVAQHVAGRGVATATVRELCGLAAAQYGLRTLKAATSRENAASQKVLARAGFIPVGPADPADLGGKQGTWYQRDLVQSLISFLLVRGYAVSRSCGLGEVLLPCGAALACGPARPDATCLSLLAPTGITQSGPSPYIAPEAHLAEALRHGLAAGQTTLKNVLEAGGSSPEVHGWKLTMHVFDYNLDYFEVGALNDPHFKITDPKVRIVERAAAAMGGLWGNHAYEAVYIMTYHDDEGDQLTGQCTYTLRLDPPPPVGAFWSLTMYDVPHFFLVANDINRYSLGDRTPGIVYADDGSLTITLSHARPGDPTAAANWLPAPAGDFRPVLRMYEPAPEVLNQTYTVPPIARS